MLSQCSETEAFLLRPAIRGSRLAGAHGSFLDQMPMWAMKMSPSFRLSRARLSSMAFGYTSLAVSSPEKPALAQPTWR